MSGLWVSGYRITKLCVPRGSKTIKIFAAVLGVFRWDYVDQQDNLPGFKKFISEGVRAEWMNPLFPSVSCPSWTTLATGLYAESHGIVGNHFYDPTDGDHFSLFDNSTTAKQKWWTAEPIWTTSTKNGLRTALYLWSRCDLPFEGVVPELCTPYTHIRGKEIFTKNLMDAINKLEDGYDFAMILRHHMSATHRKLPNNDKTGQFVKYLNTKMLQLSLKVRHLNFQPDVNIIMVSDHGLTDTGFNTVQRVELDEYLDSNLVDNIADKGAFVNIKVPTENVELVGAQLRRIPGVSVYSHQEIPDKLHFRNHKYIHEFILVANPGYWILSSADSRKMLPPRDDWVNYGGHGYEPNMQDMKAVFFAKGPDFAPGVTLGPINIVDVYQVLTHVLQISARPHNGTWSHMTPAFTKPQDPHGISAAPAFVGALVLMMLAVMFI
ncbi:unnamed protein product, partial [Meganyctiphanes norvegica]